ncbi:amidohydrolase [Ferrovibrio sp.]|uniref:amidohydrolase family protein n=1 Tax=Ferrovibrio sp. TaxID=1917215 RepID=UPI0025BD5B1B|nr:amidohydrolase family protein [Ferrovibrio sp.]
MAGIKGACDCHVHLFGPIASYPLDADSLYTPPDALSSQLRDVQWQLGIDRVVVVQPSAYGTDNRRTLSGVEELGISSTRAVVCVADDVTDRELSEMHKWGARGIRMNLVTHGIPGAEDAAARLLRAIELLRGSDWHIQLYSKPDLLVALGEIIEGSGLPVVLDHFAGLRFGAPDFASHLTNLKLLLQNSRAYIKLSGVSHLRNGSSLEQVRELTSDLIETAPDRMIWGTDWPHIDAAKMGLSSRDRILPYEIVDDSELLDLFVRSAADQAALTRILVENPCDLYGFDLPRGGK